MLEYQILIVGREVGLATLAPESELAHVREMRFAEVDKRSGVRTDLAPWYSPAREDEKDGRKQLAWRKRATNATAGPSRLSLRAFIDAANQERIAILCEIQ